VPILVHFEPVHVGTLLVTLISEVFPQKLTSFSPSHLLYGQHST